MGSTHSLTGTPVHRMKPVLILRKLGSFFPAVPSWRIHLVVLLLALVSSCTEQIPPAVDGGVRDISQFLEQERQAQDLPAVACAVISGDRIRAEGVAGVRKRGGDEPAGLEDRWHLGSCTKSITTTMIGVLVEQGKLSWDTTIAEALPDLVPAMRPEYRDVTVEHLLAHRGCIRHEWDVPGLWDVLWKREGTPVEERRKMAKVMLAQPPKVQPGKYFYSNCGYGIAGHMAETIVGEPWEQLVRQHVFEPLGMDSAGFGVPWTGEPPTDPWPHKHDGTVVEPGPFADNPPSIGPGGTVHASMKDWAAFITEHLRGARGNDGKLLRAETFQRLHKGRRIGKSEDEYALGWVVVSRPWAKGSQRGDQGRCLHHAGSNNSWYCLVWIAPERDFAVIAATNIGGDGIFEKLDAVIAAVVKDSLKRIAP